MDAVEFAKEMKRMIEYQPRKGEICYDIKGIIRQSPEFAVRIVEEWSKEHPIQTRRAKFREVFGEEPTIKLVRAMSGYGVGENATVIMDLTEWWDAPYEAPKGE